LPAERIGNRHRLLLDDVLTYRESRRKREYDALAATAVDIDSDNQKIVCARRRRAIAERRRSAHPRWDNRSNFAAVLTPRRYGIEGLYRPLWSSASFGGLEYHETPELIDRGEQPDVAAARARHLIDQMATAFEA
jgi:hypothetical protein